MPERLETERLVLRRWREEDVDSIVAIWIEPAVWDSLAPGEAVDRDRVAKRARRHLGHWDLHGFGPYTLTPRAGGEIIGWSGPTHPHHVPGLEREVEISWTLASGARGRGYATEAAAATIDHGFTDLGVDHVISLIHRDNAPSRAVAARLGMRLRERARAPRLGMELEIYELRPG